MTDNNSETKETSPQDGSEATQKAKRPYNRKKPLANGKSSTPAKPAAKGRKSKASKQSNEILAYQELIDAQNKTIEELQAQINELKADQDVKKIEEKIDQLIQNLSSLNAPKAKKEKAEKGEKEGKAEKTGEKKKKKKSKK